MFTQKRHKQQELGLSIGGTYLQYRSDPQTINMQSVPHLELTGVNNFIIQVNEAVYIDIFRPSRKSQKILLCGWRRDIDDMIVVSLSFEAPNTLSFASILQVCGGYLPKDFVGPKSHERILLCGWRRDMEDMIMVT